MFNKINTMCKYTKPTVIVVLLLFVFPVGLFNVSHNNLQAARKRKVEISHFRLGRQSWNYGLITNLERKFRTRSGFHGKDIAASLRNPMKEFVNGKFDILLRGGTVYGPLSPYDKKILTKKFGSPKNIRSSIIGRTVIYVVVHKRNPINSLTLKQLRIIYRGTKVGRGAISDWKQLGDGKKSGPIVWFMPPRGWYDSWVMRLKGMAGRLFGPRAKDFSKKPYAQQVGISAIVGNVIKDPNAIGFFAAPSGYEVDKRVKLLAIAVDKKSKPILPTPENVYEEKYPVVGRMTLYLHPNAPPEAVKFFEFAQSQEAVNIIRKYRFFPEYDRQKYFSEQRVLAAKKGKGVRVTAYGHKGGRLVLRGLVADFVKGYEPMQLKYVVKPQHVAVGEFLKHPVGVSLLMLDRPLTDKTLDRYMPTWLRQRPDKFDLGQVGVGVIVHPLNKIDWLKHEELQNIFTGKINHWSRIERSGVVAKDHLEPSIKKYALKINSKKITSRPVIDLFKEVVLNDGKKKIRKAKSYKTSKKIIDAIALNPAAIGFINLADLDPKTYSSSVKLI
ncbi:hypothetical protein MNBD_PLANCTO02-11, partial [hydrothermal vent metagenome]